MSTIQFIRDRNKRRWRVYAYRGGPHIATYEGPRKPTLSAADHRKVAEALAAKNAEPEHIFRHVIREWQRSRDWRNLSGSTRRVWQGHIDRIEAKWGEIPTTVWHDPRMAAKVVKWRDSRGDTPRSADIGVTVLRALLKWAKLSGYVPINVATDIPQIAGSADREDIIWTDDDIERFATKAKELERPHIVDGLRLAAFTGMRRADLVSLTFDHIGQFAVVKTALKKSRGKRRKAVIPMTPQLDALLTEVRSRQRADGVETILVNSFGQPWSGDGFGGSFNRIRDAAGIEHIDEDGAARKKHLHDVRGTFCTMLIAECELTDEQAADIMAWSPKRVSSIRRKYVDDARVVVAIGARIAARAKHVAKH